MQMKQFPREVHHVLLLSAIPLLYPGLGILEHLLNAFNNYPAKMLFKTGAFPSSATRAPALSCCIACCMLTTGNTARVAAYSVCDCCHVPHSCA